ncbi:hypothetical protein SRHO_G00254930 [Serrasalmus rhombeus]
MLGLHRPKHTSFWSWFADTSVRGGWTSSPSQVTGDKGQVIHRLTLLASKPYWIIFSRRATLPQQSHLAAEELPPVLPVQIFRTSEPLFIYAPQAGRARVLPFTILCFECIRVETSAGELLYSPSSLRCLLTSDLAQPNKKNGCKEKERQKIWVQLARH